MFRLHLVAIVAVVLATASKARADDLPQAEREKIEHLIKFVAEMQGAVFVRNGTEYSAATAAKFIRGKWEANASEIKSAQDFIDKAASVSGTTGKKYLIRFKDGKETPSGEYLSAELKRLDGK